MTDAEYQQTDLEVEGMRALYELLAPFDAAARERMFKWAHGRIETETRSKRAKSRKQQAEAAELEAFEAIDP